MKVNSRKFYIAGMILVLAVVAFLLTVFFMLSQTNHGEVYLMDTMNTSYGWSYETLVNGKVTSVTPEFSGEYEMSLPGDPAEAVKISRIFTESASFAYIELNGFWAGVDVFLDDELIYSDFQNAERNEEGFLLLDQEDMELLNTKLESYSFARQIRFSLPDDYTGMRLTIISYFAEGMEGSLPVYPFFGDETSKYSVGVTGTVLPVAGMTLFAVLAVMIAVIFVLNISNGKADFRMLLFGASFIFKFLDVAYNSLPGSISILSEHIDLAYFSTLYMASLFLYLALHLTKWRKYLLSVCVILWSLYEGRRIYLDLEAGNPVASNDQMAFILFCVFALLFLVEYFYSSRKMEKRKTHHLVYGGLTVSVSMLFIIWQSREWSGDVGMYLYQVMVSAWNGKYTAAVVLITNICASMAAILLVLEFIRRTNETIVMVNVLEERSRHTLEGYKRMLKAEEATNSVRHEMLHHLTALTGIIKEGDTDRAYDYITSVTGEVTSLPPGRYSQNILVNVIAGTYLDRAKAKGIRVEYSLPVPANLMISDEDLSVFLTNLLENAVEACERMAPETERYIQIRMYVNKNFLYIGCVNSRSEETKGESAGKREHRRHGYGMAAMEKIARKYCSILKVDATPSEFSVKTNLCMKNQEY